MLEQQYRTSILVQVIGRQDIDCQVDRKQSISISHQPFYWALCQRRWAKRLKMASKQVKLAAGVASEFWPVSWVTESLAQAKSDNLVLYKVHISSMYMYLQSWPYFLYGYHDWSFCQSWLWKLNKRFLMRGKSFASAWFM